MTAVVVWFAIGAWIAAALAVLGVVAGAAKLERRDPTEAEAE